MWTITQMWNHTNVASVINNTRIRTVYCLKQSHQPRVLCETCNKTISSVLCLNRHYRKHSSENWRILQMWVLKSKCLYMHKINHEVPNHACSYCSAKFRTGKGPLELICIRVHTGESAIIVRKFLQYFGQ